MNKTIPLPADILTPHDLAQLGREFPDQIQRLAEKFQRLAALDRHRQVFGAHHHDYRLGPPCPEDELRSWEVATGLRLPPDYRRFLAEVGNGGAGPYYGWAELSTVGADNLEELQRPNLLPAIAWPEWLEWEAAAGALPAGAEPLDGTIEVAGHGCMIFSHLVVHGTTAGQVWVDNTGAALGPVGTFTDWYEWWLDQGLTGANWQSRTGDERQCERG